MFEQSHSSPQWVPTQRVLQGDAWYDGGVDGRVRVDVHVRVLPQEDPHGGVWQTNEILSYDGRFGYRIMNAFTIGNDTRLRKRATILQSAPEFLRDGMQPYSDGTAYTLGFARSFLHLQNNERVRVGDVMSDLLSSSRPPSIQGDVIDNVQVVLLTDPFGNQYWFDPQRGYAMVAAQEASKALMGKSRATFYLRALKLQEAANGIWYPVAGYCDLPLLGDHPPQRINFTVEKVSINDPQFSGTIFRPAIPRSYKVTDEVNGASYTSDGSLQSLATTLQTEADNAREHFRLNAAPQTEPTHNNNDLKPNVPESGSIMAIVVAALLIVLLLGIVIFFRRRTRRLRLILILMFYLSALLCPRLTLAAESSTAAPKVDPSALSVREKFSVDACYFTLRYFQRNANIVDVINDLGAGDSCERDCSLLDLKHAFEVNGLLVAASRTPNIPNDLASVHEDVAFVVKEDIKTPAGSAAYFLVLTPANGGWLVTDPTSSGSQKVIAVNDIGARLQRATGEILVVNNRKKHRGPHLDFVYRDIDLGIVNRGAPPVKVDVPIINTGDALARIADVKTSCGCLGHAIFASAIDAAQSSQVILTLDPSLLPVGQVERQAVIITDNPTENGLIVVIHIKVIGPLDSLKSDGIYVAPSTINYGRAVASAIYEDDSEISLFVPQEQSAPTTNYVIVQQADPDLKLNFIDAHRIGNKLAFRYRIKWLHNVQFGHFAKILILSVSGQEGKPPVTFQIKVTGEAIPR